MWLAWSVVAGVAGGVGGWWFVVGSSLGRGRLVVCVAWVVVLAGVAVGGRFAGGEEWGTWCWLPVSR